MLLGERNRRENESKCERETIEGSMCVRAWGRAGATVCCGRSKERGTRLQAGKSLGGPSKRRGRLVDQVDATRCHPSRGGGPGVCGLQSGRDAVRLLQEGQTRQGRMQAAAPAREKERDVP